MYFYIMIFIKLICLKGFYVMKENYEIWMIVILKFCFDVIKFILMNNYCFFYIFFILKKN